MKKISTFAKFALSGTALARGLGWGIAGLTGASGLGFGVHKALSTMDAQSASMMRDVDQFTPEETRQLEEQEKTVGDVLKRRGLIKKIIQGKTQ
jgi:hypothetical protein